MSVTESTQALTVETARSLTEPAKVVVKRRSDGTVVESLTLLRYGGHYRHAETHTFAVKNSEGKFGIRSEHQLGFTADSEHECMLVVEEEIDVRS